MVPKTTAAIVEQAFGGIFYQGLSLRISPTPVLTRDE